MPSPGNDPADPRNRLAAERTLLAWIRTGLATMGFGFVVARFGLFLREFAAEGHRLADPARQTTTSILVGTGLIVLGVVVLLVAARDHVLLLGRIARGEPDRPPRVPLGPIFAVLLAAVGLGIVASLMNFR